MIRRAVFALALSGLLTQAGSAQTNPALAQLQTKAEASGFASTSTHAEVVAFVKAVDQASPIVHYVAFGKSGEGRELPLAVVGSGLKDGSAASVLATGKLRVHIQGNIHAGEVEGKESAQILLRDLAMGQHASWLASMVLLITPIYNADGNEKFSMTNRGTQNGPINGMGTRATAQNINLNRDYTKLEAPESRAFVKLWNDYDPHVGMDLHTSNGSAHAYHLTYSPPLHPATNDAIMNVMKGEWFPFITSQIKQKRGWDTFYYGNAGRLGGGRGAGRGGAPGAGRGEGAGRGAVVQPDIVGVPPPPTGPRAWGTFEHVPRFHNNYVGIRNRFALLSEAYSYATFKDRILATNYFIEEAMNFAHQHAERLKQIVAVADAEPLVGRAVATRAALTTGGLIDVLMGEVEEIKNPNNGARMNQRVNVSRVEPMVDRLWFAPTALEDVPVEYYLPAGAAKSLDVLRAHGVVLRQLTAPVTGVEEFVITSNTAQPARNSIDTQNHELRRLEGYWRQSTAVVPAGAYAVAMNQKLARLAFLMLAPTSDDGLVNWNFLDDQLTGTTYPIWRRR